MLKHLCNFSYGRWQLSGKGNNELIKVFFETHERDQIASILTELEQEVISKVNLSPEQKGEIEQDIEKLRAAHELESEGKSGPIAFTDELKGVVLPFAKQALIMERWSSHNTLEAVLFKGRLVYEIDRVLKTKKLRIFRAFCTSVKWGKSSAYKWMKLYQGFGDNLTDYAGIAENKLVECCKKPDPMKFIDENREKIVAAKTLQDVKRIVDPTWKPQKPRGVHVAVKGKFTAKFTKSKSHVSAEGFDEDDWSRFLDWLDSRPGAQDGEVSTAVDTSSSNENSETSSNTGNGIPSSDENELRGKLPRTQSNGIAAYVYIYYSENSGKLSSEQPVKEFVNEEIPLKPDTWENTWRQVEKTFPDFWEIHLKDELGRTIVKTANGEGQPVTEWVL